jgi:7-cyano-7-deazaguanine reductase
MNLQTRRAILTTSPNPDERLDYVVALRGHAPGRADGGNAAEVRLRYVPDRRILDPVAFGAYLTAAGGEPEESVEGFAAMVLDDINNELVPRWVQITVTATSDGIDGVDGHGVMLEDRQPRWDNPALLSRLERY